MLCKRAFIYICCFGLYEYSCPYSFETLYLFNLKGQCFRWEELMWGKEVNYSFKNKYCLVTPFSTCVFNTSINQRSVKQPVCTRASSHKKTHQVLNAFVCLFSPSERGKSYKGECISLSCKMNYFCVCVGSVGLSVLELGSGWWLSAFLMTLLHVSENQTVFRAGLVYSDHVTLQHHSYFIWLLFLLFFTEGSKPSHCPVSSALMLIH